MPRRILDLLYTAKVTKDAQQLLLMRFGIHLFVQELLLGPPSVLAPPTDQKFSPPLVPSPPWTPDSPSMDTPSNLVGLFPWNHQNCFIRKSSPSTSREVGHQLDYEAPSSNPTYYLLKVRATYVAGLDQNKSLIRIQN